MFTEFTSCRGDKGEEGPRYKGQFLDPANLLNGLTGRRWTLAEALPTFNGQTLDRDDVTGSIDPVAIDRCPHALTRHSFADTDADQALG